MNVERRRALGIPIHSEAEHQWRADGFCNCGARQKPELHIKAHRVRRDRVGGTAGHSNLDRIEHNAEEEF